MGSLYPTTVAFSDVDPTIGQFWIQKKWNNRFGIQGGKLFPLAVYDYFPLKNFRTDFMDAIHAANFVIPLPDRGLGSYVMYRPTPETEHYLRVGVHDANADAEEFDFDVFDDGELFTIIEFGWDPGITPQMPGRPPLGDIHLSFWQQDERFGRPRHEVYRLSRVSQLLPYPFDVAVRYGQSPCRAWQYGRNAGSKPAGKTGL